MAQIDIEPTPNPNSLKITAAGRSFIPSGMESFNSAAEAGNHPLGSRLFETGGVMNVFILPQFMTVTKRPEVEWDDIFPAIEQIIEAHLEGEG